MGARRSVNVPRDSYRYKRNVRSYRIWLYGFNATLLVSLTTFVAVSANILFQDKVYLFPLDHKELLVAYLFCGPLAQLVDILIGLAGVWRRQATLLMVYWWFMLAILLCDLVVGFLWIFRWRTLRAELGGHLADHLEQTYDESFCRRWNNVQTDLECCGVDSFRDWRPLEYFCNEALNGTALPSSCCFSDNFRSMCRGNQSVWEESDAKVLGCRDALIRWLYAQSNTVFLLGLCLVEFLKIVGLIITRTEIRKLNEEFFARRNAHMFAAHRQLSVDESPFVDAIRRKLGYVRAESRDDTPVITGQSTSDNQTRSNGPLR